MKKLVKVDLNRYRQFVGNVSTGKCKWRIIHNEEVEFKNGDEIDDKLKIKAINQADYKFTAPYLSTLEIFETKTEAEAFLFTDNKYIRITYRK